MKIISSFLILIAAILPAAEIHDIPYLKDAGPLQKLDLYLPDAKSSSPRPVLIAIHGGGWAIGDKSNRGFVKPKIPWLNSEGFIVASINYRLSPAVTHPAHIQDVCAAIAWVQKNIAKHGGDPKQIYLLGHSAGAHLAALAAVDQVRIKAAGIDPSGFRGVILLDGVAYDVPHQIESSSPKKKLSNMYIAAFTADPATQRDASPALKITRKSPPFLILHIARRPSSSSQSKRLSEALKKSGGWTSLIPIAGKNHASINRDLGKAGDPTTKAVAAFLGTKPD